jgi:hypothetical protein
MTRTTKPAAVSGDTNAAVLSERLRVSSIIESPEGRRNPALASELALRSSIDAETARSILGKAPSSNPFTEAMDRLGPVNIGANVADFNSDPRAARLKEIETSVSAFNADRRGEKPAKKKG